MLSTIVVVNDKGRPLASLNSGAFVFREIPSSPQSGNVALQMIFRPAPMSKENLEILILSREAPNVTSKR